MWDWFIILLSFIFLWESFVCGRVEFYCFIEVDELEYEDEGLVVDFEGLIGVYVDLGF